DEVPQILVGENPEQTSPLPETARELGIGEVGAAVASLQPVLLLGEIVMANSGPMQLAKRGAGGMKIRMVPVRFGNLQGNSIDPAAHEYAPSGKEERRRDAELARDCERFALTREQEMGDSKAPPWHLVHPAQYPFHLALSLAKAAALHGRERVAFEHEATHPAALELGRQAHRLYSAATA